MAKGRSVWFLIFIAFLLVTSCTKNGNGTVPAAVTKAEGPDSVSANQEASFTVSYVLINGCGSFDHIENDTRADTTTLYVMAKYKGSSCTDVVLMEETKYAFKFSKRGTYYLKFWQSADTYLIDSVVVR